MLRIITLGIVSRFPRPSGRMVVYRRKEKVQRVETVNFRHNPISPDGAPETCCLSVLQLYAHSVSEDRMAAQGEMLEAILQSSSEAVN
jgi:hypothetical protein